MSEWILCEERLPDKCDQYLITTSNGRVKIDRFYPDSKVWGVNTRYGYKNVEYIAWMPIPKAYQKGQNNEADQ